ncbi:MAG: ABC transporter substrate-binding protein [Muribaculaceae bacterium]|nr:ABC transporter substrate-binding protein [Muribaculaceae bacterium]
MKIFITSIAVAIACLLGSACSRTGTADDEFEDVELADTVTHHASYLTIARMSDGTARVDISDPWNRGEYLGRYLLVHRDSLLPEDIESDVTVIRTPVERAAVFSSVHTAAMDELGAIGSLAAVADAAYFPAADTVAALLAAGRVADVGQSTLPSAEKLAVSGAEILLRSPMQGAAAMQLPRGVVPLEMADYMEISPIGRAEWILLLGELFGKQDLAQAIFTDVIDEYSALVYKASQSTSPSPTVLMETEVSGVWYVPAGGSYQARIIADAGAIYPWSDTDGSGSLPLSFEAVVDKALDADLWLVRSYGYETSASTLKALNPRYSRFKALRQGNIYSCNSAERLIFNDIAFHPEKVLADYVAIFHPDAMPGYELKYFRKSGK